MPGRSVSAAVKAKATFSQVASDVIFKVCVCYVVCWMWGTSACHSMCVEIRGQPSGVISFPYQVEMGPLLMFGLLRCVPRQAGLRASGLFQGVR